MNVKPISCTVSGAVVAEGTESRVPSTARQFPAAGLMGGSPGCGEDVGRIQMICPLSGWDWYRRRGVIVDVWVILTPPPAPPPPPPRSALHVACVHMLACASQGEPGVGADPQVMKQAVRVCVRVCVTVHGEHLCVVCACVAGKAAVSHPRASVACYHGSQAAGTPPPHLPDPFFF